MTKKIFMVAMMVLFCTASAMATVNEKGKIYIKPVAMLPDGTIVKTSYDEASEELSVEAEEAAGEETSDIWMEVVIYKDGMEVAFASFNPFTRQLCFNLSDYGAGTYQIYTVSGTAAELIGVIELKNE